MFNMYQSKFQPVYERIFNVYLENVCMYLKNIFLGKPKRKINKGTIKENTQKNHKKAP